MRMVTADEVARALDWAGLIDRIETLFREGCESPPRHHHTIPRSDGDATLLLMPAWREGGDIGVKVATVFPQNAERDLPAVSALYLLLDRETGQPLACIEGSELTKRRTAAASALAARYLARRDAKTMVMVGTGALAPMLIEAHASVRPIRKIRIWGRTPDKAAALAGRFQAQGADCEAVTDLEAAVRQADVVSCATLATEPLVQGDWLRPGAHLDLVGAFRPDMRESDDDCLRRASVFVDTHAGARGEAGDILQAMESGAFAEADIQADLAALTRGEHPGRQRDDEITLFKSVGASLEDLAAAIELWSKLA